MKTIEIGLDWAAFVRNGMFKTPISLKRRTTICVFLAPFSLYLKILIATTVASEL